MKTGSRGITNLTNQTRKIKEPWKAIHLKHLFIIDNRIM